MLQIGSFTLTPDDIKRRKDYLEITLEDEKRLREAHPHLAKHTASIIDRFYEFLLAHEHTRSMLAAPGLVDRLKKLQTQYFGELTSGNYDLAYFENRLRVGQVHHRIGLSPEWYMGAYVKYLHIASDVLSTAFGRDYERFFQTIVSLDKSLAIDAFQHAAQEALETKSAELEKKTSELEVSNEGLRRAQAAKRQLTDMIVHDLQNPLSGMSAALQIISTGETLSESARMATAEATRRCQDLAGMILNVLQVSRAETGDLETYLESIDLVQVGSEVTQGFSIAAHLESRTLRLEAPKELVIWTDQSLVRRILQNLIRNALRHTPEGTTVIVKVAAQEDGGARVSVSDDGPGISKEVQPRLFEPFGTSALRKAGVRVDTGLGLPSCQVMARAIAAELRVESDGRRGSTFSLLLPRPSTKG